MFRSFNLIQKKVSKYWPDHNGTKRNGNITIHCQTERIYAEHVIRHLRVHTSFVSYLKYWCLISYFKIMYSTFIPTFRSVIQIQCKVYYYEIVFNLNCKNLNLKCKKHLFTVDRIRELRKSVMDIQEYLLFSFHVG